MSDLEKLAARVEALVGPDREVDISISTALGLVPAAYERAVIHDKPHPYFWHVEDTHAPYWIPPRFTGSLDDVRTLIGDEEWDLSTQHCIARATVGIERDYQTSWPGHGEHAGNDPVLALLAAALRARTLIPSSRRGGRSA